MVSFRKHLWGEELLIGSYELYISTQTPSQLDKMVISKTHYCSLLHTS